MKVQIKALSLNQLKEKYPKEFYPYNAWWFDEKFADEKPKAETLEVDFLVKNSLNKSWDKQKKLVKKPDFIPSISVLVQVALAYKQENGDWPQELKDYWTRSSSVAADGGRVGLYGDVYGLVVHDWYDGAGSSVGVAAARKSVEPRTLKPRASEPLSFEISEIKVNGKTYVLKAKSMKGSK